MTEHFEFTTDENGKVISMGGEKDEALKLAIEALELFTKSVDHRAAIASYPMQYVTRAHRVLEDIRRLRGKL